MCFAIHENYPNALVNTKDIRCFKRLSIRNEAPTSPINTFYWAINKLVRVKLEIFTHYIHEGFHSYSSLKKAKREMNSWNILCEFIIPAGSTYYFNPDYNEYVSNQIMWTGRIYRIDRWVPYKLETAEKIIKYGW